MEPSDTELVIQAGQGSQQALAGIYDRYSDRVYSFCLSRLRNPEQAADATQDTFVRAMSGIGNLRRPERLRSWLFAIARNRILDTVKDRDRLEGSEVGEMVSTAADPDTDLLRAESAALLWEAAGSLQERDRDLLELELREGLSGQDLADALEVTTPHLHTMQSRLRDRVEKALGGLLVARQGRDDCSGLAEVLSGWDGRYTLDVRSRITRHVSSCEVCERTRRAVVRPEAFLGALPLTAAPALLRDRTIGAMAEAVGTSPPTSEGTASPESPVESPGTPQFSEMTVAPTSGIARLAGTRWFTATAVTALILLFTGATIMVVVFYKGPPGPPAGDQPVATTSSAADQDQASAPSSTPVVATDSPAAESPTTAPSTTGAPTTAAPTTSAPTTAAPTTSAPTTTAAVPTTTAPTTGEPNPGPRFVRLMARPTSVVAAEGSCPGQSTEVVALVDDPDGVSTVVVQWSNGVDELTTPLDPAGSSHVGIVGPFGFPGPTVLTVIATDTLGAVATAELSLDVSPCP